MHSNFTMCVAYLEYGDYGDEGGMDDMFGNEEEEEEAAAGEAGHPFGGGSAGQALQSTSLSFLAVLWPMLPRYFVPPSSCAHAHTTTFPNHHNHNHSLLQPVIPFCAVVLIALIVTARFGGCIQISLRSSAAEQASQWVC